MSLMTVENVSLMYNLPLEKECYHCKKVFKFVKVIQSESAIGLAHPDHEPCGEENTNIVFCFTDKEGKEAIKKLFENQSK